MWLLFAICVHTSIHVVIPLQKSRKMTTWIDVCTHIANSNHNNDTQRADIWREKHRRIL